MIRYHSHIIVLYLLGSFFCIKQDSQVEFDNVERSFHMKINNFNFGAIRIEICHLAPKKQKIEETW